MRQSRAAQPFHAIRSVAADTASRTTVAYARILFHKWGNPAVPFVPLAADLDLMLERTIGLEEGGSRKKSNGRSGVSIIGNIMLAQMKVLGRSKEQAKENAARGAPKYTSLPRARMMSRWHRSRLAR